MYKNHKVHGGKDLFLKNAKHCRTNWFIPVNGTYNAVSLGAYGYIPSAINGVGSRNRRVVSPVFQISLRADIELISWSGLKCANRSVSVTTVVWRKRSPDSYNFWCDPDTLFCVNRNSSGAIFCQPLRKNNWNHENKCVSMRVISTFSVDNKIRFWVYLK